MTVHIGSVGPPIRANTMEPEVYRQDMQSILGGVNANPGLASSGDLAVTQNGTPNMSVNVGVGFAYVKGTNNAPVQGVYHAYNDAAVNVIVPTANASFPRIDLICLTIQDAFYSGATNTALLQDVAGVAASSPLVPSAPANSLVLAHVYVGAAAASILNANINTTAGTNNPDTTPYAAPLATVIGSARQAAIVTTTQSTATTTYTSLATVGPVVSLNTGTAALVILACAMGSTVQFHTAFMSIAVSGATTIAASDVNALLQHDPDTNSALNACGFFLMTGLTPGLNTFTAMYRADAGASATFGNRAMVVIPI